MPKAIYEGIYREIRSRIINGTYAFQEMLPTEAELTAEFGCTRNTVRRALAMLADEMYVQPIHGKGVRVMSARVAEGQKLAPSEVVAQKKRVLLGCADGALEVLSVKPDGKKEMPAASWAAGLRGEFSWERI